MLLVRKSRHRWSKLRRAEILRGLGLKVVQGWGGGQSSFKPESTIARPHQPKRWVPLSAPSCGSKISSFPKIITCPISYLNSCSLYPSPHYISVRMVITICVASASTSPSLECRRKKPSGVERDQVLRLLHLRRVSNRLSKGSRKQEAKERQRTSAGLRLMLALPCMI